MVGVGGSKTAAVVPFELHETCIEHLASKVITNPNIAEEQH
jgi:hypothetical protein